MAYVAVDKDGTEKISDNCLKRFNKWIVWFGVMPKITPKNTRNKWVDTWLSYPPYLEFQGVKLPKGSIAKLIGRTLTWDDEPVELKEE